MPNLQEGQPEQAFDPNTYYRVRVSRVVEIGGLIVTPRDGAVLNGLACEAIRAAILSAEAEG